MAKLSRVTVILGALLAGVVGGFLSGMVIQRAPEAQATVREHPSHDISSGKDRSAWIVDSAGNVYYATTNSVKKAGVCR